jgi:hypothetical protein
VQRNSLFQIISSPKNIRNPYANKKAGLPVVYTSAARPSIRLWIRGFPPPLHKGLSFIELAIFLFLFLKNYHKTISMSILYYLTDETLQSRVAVAFPPRRIA